jgi:hypothetical protein
MKRKYLALDIETAKILPADAGELLAHRPLGISCLATICEDETEPQLFFSKESNRYPSSQMRKKDLAAFIDSLMRRVHDGFTLLTLPCGWLTVE